MEQKTQSTKMLRQRKFLLVMPLLLLPFITLMFWSLGGGKIENADAKPIISKGFNLNLPEAYLKEDKPFDKMSYYDKAASDSAKREELIKNDPNYRRRTSLKNVQDERQLKNRSYSKDQSTNEVLITSPYGHGIAGDSNEVKVYRKLAELDKVMNHAVTSAAGQKNDSSFPMNENTRMDTSDADRLEQMMQAMNQQESNDPELQQLNALMEKILDIQHPDRVQEKIRQTSETRKGQVFAVSASEKETPVSLLENSTINREDIGNLKVQMQQNGFYSLDEPSPMHESQNAIQAVIHETQTLVAGSTVKLRLVNDVFINGVLIPKNNFLFGEAMLNGERLDIKINSIRFQNSLFPVELSVFDLDGLEGIYIPGAITRDAAKQSTDRAIQGIGLTSLDPSWEAQAAGAGIDAAKNLISKKVKLVKVTVKAGYKILLWDEKQK